MKKFLFTLLFGLLLLSGSAFAGVDCKAGIVSCQFHDSMLDLALQPAIRFTVLEDQVVHIEATIWPEAAYDPQCTMGDPQMSMGDLPLQAGDHIVFLRFDPPLPTDTPFSIKWKVGTCPETDCDGFVIGDAYYPEGCAVSKGATEPTVSYIEASL